MVKLFCVFVGVAGNAFEVDIDDSESVGGLKNVIWNNIKEKFVNDERFKGVVAMDLQLFLAKRKHLKVEAKENGEENGEKEWLTEEEVQNGVHDTSGYTLLSYPGAELRDVGLASKDLGEVSEGGNAAGLGHIHVMVQVPRQTFTGKRTREQEWFVDDRMIKKAKVDGDEIQYFTMDQFPLIAHPVERYNKIMERDAYRVIFAELMDRVKKSFETRSPANLVVTGNSGTGKSWFYLYCIFQLILGNKEGVEEFPAFDLVLNFDNDYQLYDDETKEFVRLNEEEVHERRNQYRVLRLVESKSSHLMGWKGVSILFASPGLDGMNNYLKVDSFRYIMPVWSLEELQDCNSLLDDKLKVREDVLITRYNKFGGIPRFIFCYSDPRNEQELKAALSGHSAMDIISYIRRQCTVTDENDRVFAMVPSRPDFRDAGHLDVLSNYVTEKVVSKAFDDGIQAVSDFALEAVDDSRYGSVREKMYEVLCHKWFELPRKRILQIRSLTSQRVKEVTLREMQTIRFSSLNDIKVFQPYTYYWPSSKVFCALDAFFTTGNDCFGLKMTRNLDHGIKAAPLNTLLTWLKDVGIDQENFHFVFVVPSHLAGSFKMQRIRNTAACEVVTQTSGVSTVNQYVGALDVVVGNHSRR